MAITAYCKKCGLDYPMTEICPRCGAKLGRNTGRVAWCVDHTPARDWMSWNEAMRIILPVGALVLALILGLEAASGGGKAVEELLRGGLVYTLLGLVGLLILLMLLVFVLQGEDVLDCVVDSRGVHLMQYLPDPTPFKLILHLRSPRLMAQVRESGEDIVLIAQHDLAWKDIARVQLWPERTMILFYAPTWWMRVYLPCTPFTYEDVMAYISDRIGAKKKVIMPDELRTIKPRSTLPKRPAQRAMDAERPVPEMPDDFSNIADVLGEIKAMNDQDVAPRE